VAVATVELVRCPRVVQAVIAAIATNASSRAYSTVVRPSSSFQSCNIRHLSYQVTAMAKPVKRRL